ncbi:MAG: hypothetical protein AUK35_09105 [Zetaproteobacteria bacterium CG2_30_46_52]|nr:MAG: hypothetical protein AUK35_09105 [Zetaproteobacteria bacterium CG2_30_46_52]
MGISKLAVHDEEFLSGRFVYDEDIGHSIFSSEFNPDGLKDKWIQLHERFKELGVALGYDSDINEYPVFELHLNVHERVKQADCPAYVILLEDSHVYLPNGDKGLLSHYKKVFTWDDSLVDGDRFVKITFSPRITPAAFASLSDRTLFCCIIAANKSLPAFSENDLYSERVRVIRWFERNAPDDFALYGGGWGHPPRKPGLAGKVLGLLFRILRVQNWVKCFPSWKGKVDVKQDLLQSTKFTFAYENVSDVPGYITEKIFDAFSAGCVPVYWGASNITDYIPEDCFIDARKFADIASIYAFMKGMSDEEYYAYQHAIDSFIKSESIKMFSPACFAHTISDSIIQDINA